MKSNEFDWQGWFGRFENQINRMRPNEIGVLIMQGQQLVDAMKELTDAVNTASAAAQNQTPDSVITPVIAQIAGLAAQLKAVYPPPS